MELSLPLSRRSLLATGTCALAVAACAPISRTSSELAVYKTPTCGCCTAWVDYMRSAGFEARITELPSLRSTRSTQGVPEALASCHTALIGGYVLEGHVPAEDVRRLLAERPNAVGLAVPAMPLGSPGMETPDGRREPYETLLILEGGGTRVFARHA
ncbi:MAG: DUF411 domain-containing protein [Caulobacteraceae bacterium]|jgi:hypothetical protein|nr:DUF411 domain-containing protein [Alphaproteobacteria bacterium]MBX9708091.1 DUF411 domain-containing protein [Caulobacteraceae bacterium]MBU1525884.1 DUF411 domain-containing protein [Alphaproteobacteria bacterium]MBU2117231.1 DUF411 domain-containing protein [Alphaproteobacteria bacterium]MBU2350441.1 DUF411 domain-containing protein [Alphaproteobacteria bacterium]